METQEIISLDTLCKTSSLHTRDEAKKIFIILSKRTKNSKNYRLNFRKITFISRSFAHELLKSREILNKDFKIKVEFENLNKEVSGTISNVEKSLTAKKDTTSTKNIKIYSTRDSNELSNFLLKI